MGFTDSLKKWAGAISPTTWLSTGSQIAGDYLSAKQAGKDADSAREANMYMSEEDRQLQRDFAKHGIRWRAEDAAAAGIHPLAALGAQIPSGSPVAIPVQGDYSKSEFYSRMGQNLSRAFNSVMTPEEKAFKALQLESMAIDNAIKKKELEGITNPSLPLRSDNFNMSGQGDSGLMDVRPVRTNVSQPGRPAQEAGWVPDVSYSRTDTGLTPMIPQGLSESLEDDLVGKVMWRIRNQLMPNISGKGAPPKNQLPKGYSEWRWDTIKQEWQPYNRDPFPLKTFIKNNYWYRKYKGGK